MRDRKAGGGLKEWRGNMSKRSCEEKNIGSLQHKEVSK